MIRTTNVADVKSNLSKFRDAVERGDEISVGRRSIPFARIVALPLRPNRTKLGSQRDRVQVLGPVTEPAIPETDWAMLGTGKGS
jgi:antitoxin (DNA-binding transcriptional repressor) of toxin-antitoxin stability system